MDKLGKNILVHHHQSNIPCNRTSKIKTPKQKEEKNRTRRRLHIPKKQQQDVNNYSDQFLKCIKIRQNQTRHHQEKYEEEI